LVLRPDCAGEPGAGLDPAMAGPVPALVDIEPAVIDLLGPAKDKAAPDGAPLPRMGVGDRVAVPPARADDRRRAPVTDRVLACSRSPPRAR
jgi:hypothetical protein